MKEAFGSFTISDGAMNNGNQGLTNDPQSVMVRIAAGNSSIIHGDTTKSTPRQWIQPV